MTLVAKEASHLCEYARMLKSRVGSMFLLSNKMLILEVMKSLYCSMRNIVLKAAIFSHFGTSRNAGTLVFSPR